MATPRARTVQRLYALLLEAYQPQGWWPHVSLIGLDSFDARGYHPNVYEFPKTVEQRFEVILGAILTQNTAWTNVEKVLHHLHTKQLLGRRPLEMQSVEKLAGLIRASGYFNQKAKKIKAMLEFLRSERPMTRNNLLRVWGVGPETADSILLYAYHQPIFVVDAYTKRIVQHLGLVKSAASYDEVQTLFHDALTPTVPLFNEYHALLVEHAKRYYSKKPYGQNDPFVALLRGGRGN